jgi:hypothetical protein
LIRKLETSSLAEKTRISVAFSAHRKLFLKTSESLAGGAVLIKPVSGRIPCYQGISGNFAILRHLETI